MPGNTHGVVVNKAYDVEVDPRAIKVGERTLQEWAAEIEGKIDTILEAIALNHQKGPDGKCVPDCWSCRVEETMEGIRVSRRIQGK